MHGVVLIRLKQLVELYILFIIRISAPRSDFVFVIRKVAPYLILIGRLTQVPQLYFLDLVELITRAYPD